MVNTRASTPVFQLFSDHTSLVEVTQATLLETTLSSSSASVEPSGGPTKKRRLESGWCMVRDAIADNGQQSHVIPWYVILNPPQTWPITSI